MKITNIKIKRIAPCKGHVGFASCVIDNWLYLNNIAIFTRLNDEANIRLVFPEKRVGDKRIPLFHPLNSEDYYRLEKEILAKFYEICQ